MVRLVELMADAAGERREERRGRFLRLGRLVERLLRTHGGGTEDRGATLRLCSGDRCSIAGKHRA